MSLLQKLRKDRETGDLVCPCQRRKSVPAADYHFPNLRLPFIAATFIGQILLKPWCFLGTLESLWEAGSLIGFWFFDESEGQVIFCYVLHILWEVPSDWRLSRLLCIYSIESFLSISVKSPACYGRNAVGARFHRVLTLKPLWNLKLSEVVGDNLRCPDVLL